MDIQKWYDVVYTIKLVGTSDSEKIVKSMLIRSGKRDDASTILNLYNEIVAYAEKHGYNDPMDFIKDYFYGKYSEMIGMSGNQLSRLKLDNETNDKGIFSGSMYSNEKKLFIPSNMYKVMKNENNEENITNRKENYDISDKIIRPEKLLKEGSFGSIFVIPSEIKNKITKSKKMIKYYREMQQKEKEIDNKFDYFAEISRKDESGNFFQDNRESMENFPLIGNLFDSMDIKYRKIMDDIINRNKNTIKDKNKWMDEIKILIEYFKNKLNIDQEDQLATKRLGVIISSLMKQIQLKIFETEDIETIRLLLNFKLQLTVFYNYYKK